MSEALPGMPPLPSSPPVAPRLAAVAVLYRRVGAGVEVFWVKREKALRFAGGFYAFPGGKVDKADARVPVRGASGEQAAILAAAARELFEETGVLVAEGAERLSPERLKELRRALLADERQWGELLTEAGLTLRAEDFRPAGRWITPPFMPVRFDTWFFLVEAPAHAVAELWPGELTEAAWVQPAEALERWKQGTALLHSPGLYVLQVLERFDTPEAVLARLEAPPYCPDSVATLIEFQQGVRIIPMATPTLPPATHTNGYVLGNGELLLVDPGAEDASEFEKLKELLTLLEGEGMRPVAVVLTHHHWDHIGGAQRVKEQLGLPLWCHARTADRLNVPVDRLLEDGEVLELAGNPPQRWRVLHTPGHARGHLCLVDERTRAAVVGDMVAGVGTIVIDPPEGNMRGLPGAARAAPRLARHHAVPGARRGDPRWSRQAAGIHRPSRRERGSDPGGPATLGSDAGAGGGAGLLGHAPLPAPGGPAQRPGHAGEADGGRARPDRTGELFPRLSTPAVADQLFRACRSLGRQVLHG